MDLLAGMAQGKNSESFGRRQAFDGFLVTVSTNGSTTETQLISSDQTTLELLTLEPDTNYTVNIATIVGSGTSTSVVSSPVTLSFRTSTCLNGLFF